MYDLPVRIPPALVIFDATSFGTGVVFVQPMQNNVVHGQTLIFITASGAGDAVQRFQFEVPDGVFTLYCTLVGGGSVGGGSGSIIYEWPVNVEPGMVGLVNSIPHALSAGNGQDAVFAIGGWTLTAQGGQGAAGGVATITDPKGNTFTGFPGQVSTNLVNWGSIGQGGASPNNVSGLIFIKW